MSEKNQRKEDSRLARSIQKINKLEEDELKKLGQVLDSEGNAQLARTLMWHSVRRAIRGNPTSRNRINDNASQLSRRTFLKKSLVSVTALGAMTFLDNPLAQAVGFPLLQNEVSSGVEREVVNMGEIPPTIMFHARHNQAEILPGFIDQLKAEGYTFTTYTEWKQSLESGKPVERPIILTFDDITFTNGSNQSSFNMFRRMFETLREKQVKGVFAVITEPIVIGTNNAEVQLVEQNDELWSEARDWVKSGVIEFATHTASHPDLGRPDYGKEDFEREIIFSAKLIEDNTGQPVSTLITPFGSGFLTNPNGQYVDTNNQVTDQPVLLEGVLEACSKIGIKFVVGIAGMRKPIPYTASDGTLVYGVGRIQPNDSLSNDDLANSLIDQAQSWTESNN